jgi:AraC-like DNA-binding protein
MRFYQQERAITQVTELICDLMEQKHVSRAKLAQLLKKSRSYVTQLLDGETNMTVRTISDVFTVLGHEQQTYASPITIGQESEATGDVESVPQWDERNWTEAAEWGTPVLHAEPVTQVV